MTIRVGRQAMASFSPKWIIRDSRIDAGDWTLGMAGLQCSVLEEHVGG